MLIEGSTTLFAAAWLGVCLVAWLQARRWNESWLYRRPVLTIAGAAAVARAVPAVVLDRGLPFDISAHWWIGTLTLAGRNVYTEPLAQNRYPYPPLHSYISAFMVLVSGHDRALFLTVDKLVPAACGTGIAVVVWAAAQRLGRGEAAALHCGLLYALNPLPVLVTAYHGQFEEIPLFFIVLALFLLLGARQTAGTVILSALVMGVSVAYKTWPLLLVPPLMLLARGWGRRALYLPLTFVPLATSLWLYSLTFGRGAFASATGRLLGYKGPDTFCWGYVSVLRECWVRNSALRHNAWVLPLNNIVLLAGLLLVGVALLLSQRPLEGMVAAPLVFYLFSPGWGPNYSVWVVPFVALAGTALAVRYTLVMLPIIALSYWDSLYVAYNLNHFSYAVLKPIEAVLGLVGWAGIGVLLACLYLNRWLSAVSLRRPRRLPRFLDMATPYAAAHDDAGPVE